MNILLTGATGFLGKILSNEIADDHQIIALVRNKEGGQKNVCYIIQDLCLPFDLSRFPASIDVVVHLAQSRYYKDFPNSALDMFGVNTGSTAILMDYALRAGAKQFIYASTGGLYHPCDEVLTEERLLNPVGYYNVTKYAAEQFLCAYKSYLNICVMRLFFLYGAGQKDRLVSSLYEKISTYKPVILEGKNNGLYFTPTYGQDVARIIKLAIKNNWSGIYNVASPEISNIREISQKIASIINCEPYFHFLGAIEPPPIIPSLQGLKMIYPEMEFTELDVGLRETFSTKKVYKPEYA